MRRARIIGEIAVRTSSICFTLRPEKNERQRRKVSRRHRKLLRHPAVQIVQRDDADHAADRHLLQQVELVLHVHVMVAKRGMAESSTLPGCPGSYLIASGRGWLLSSLRADRQAAGVRGGGPGRRTSRPDHGTRGGALPCGYHRLMAEAAAYLPTKIPRCRRNPVSIEPCGGFTVGMVQTAVVC